MSSEHTYCGNRHNFSHSLAIKCVTLDRLLHFFGLNFVLHETKGVDYIKVASISNIFYAYSPLENSRGKGRPVSYIIFNYPKGFKKKKKPICRAKMIFSQRNVIVLHSSMGLFKAL